MSSTSSPHRPRHFASDNQAPICPEAWQAMDAANQNHAAAYGADPWTDQACQAIRDFLETNAQVFLVFNGTSANALALAHLHRSYHSVLCHASAHIQHDECGAPEFFSGGARLLPLPGDHGLLLPSTIEHTVLDHFPLHSSKPATLSLTQATELGTVYTPDHLADLSRTAHRLGLKVHLDGARLANAIAHLNVAPADLTWRAGIDVLSLGFTKNGGAISEAVIFFNPDLARDFEYRIKQGGQLASKMRYLAASWCGLLTDGAWLRHAAHANAMARQLAHLLEPLPGLQILHPVQANGVFVDLPLATIQQLHARGWHFYVFEGDTGCRLMCSWDTSEADLLAFVNDLRQRL